MLQVYEFVKPPTSLTGAMLKVSPVCPEHTVVALASIGKGCPGAVLTVRVADVVDTLPRQFETTHIKVPAVDVV